jgi:hypothetical protein
MPKKRRKHNRRVPPAILAIMREESPDGMSQGMLHRATAFFQKVKRSFDAFSDAVQ